MDPVLPVFIVIAEKEQVGELREYLESLGASFDGEQPADLSENLSQMFAVCGGCVKACSESEMEGLMNSLLSLIFVVNEKRDDLIRQFIITLVEIPVEQHPAVRLRIMNVLFCGLNELDPIRYDVYCSQLQLASKTDLIDHVTTDLEQVNRWLAQWNDVDKSRELYRLLHETLVANKQSENATRVMIELLGTYSEDSDAQAKEDAVSCIKSFIDRPDVWIMDHLLVLGPVKSLKGELMHQLLEIFVSGNFHDYIQFYENNSNFVESSGLNHERNLVKMRILTFLSLVHKHNEMTFEELSKELDINVDDVEGFIIEVLKTRLVRVRIDELAGKVITSSAAHRTFNKPQWQMLRDKLTEWQSNLRTVRKQLSDVEVM